MQHAWQTFVQLLPISEQSARGHICLYITLYNCQMCMHCKKVVGFYDKDLKLAKEILQNAVGIF